jgi:hypothetical protein
MQMDIVWEFVQALGFCFHDMYQPYSWQYHWIVCIDVDSIPPQPLHTYVTKNLHYKYTFIHNSTLILRAHKFLVQ